MSFLKSFSSEFREFVREPLLSQSQNEIWEIEKRTVSTIKIKWILFEKKTSRRLQFLINWQVDVRDSDHTFFFEKNQELKKWEYIIDGDLKYLVKYVKKVYVFNAIYDHNVADLQLIE